MPLVSSTLDVLVALEQVQGLDVQPIDGIDLAGGQRIGARRHIGDGQRFDLVEVPVVGTPVVLVALEFRPNTRFVAL